MSKFERRNTIVELEIEGNTFMPDFGRDGVRAVMMDASQKILEIENGHKDMKDAKKRYEAIETEEKTVLKNAINELLQDEKASEKIFFKDNTSAFIADVYSFITNEFEATMRV